MTNTVTYLIESGSALEMVQKHISGLRCLGRDVSSLVEEMGYERATTERISNVLFGVVFASSEHAKLAMPNRDVGVSRSKKGAEWAMRFAAEVGYSDPCAIIQKAFGIPTSIEYTCNDGSYGSSTLVDSIDSCGFAFLSANGPFALWIPDVAAEVARYEAQGRTVEVGVKSFSMDLPGCRRLENAEWDALVAQHELDKNAACKPHLLPASITPSGQKERIDHETPVPVRYAGNNQAFRPIRKSFFTLLRYKVLTAVSRGLRRFSTFPKGVGSPGPGYQAGKG